MGKLMNAVKKKDVDTVKQLVSGGADPNKPEKVYGEDMNPYSYALRCCIWGGVVSDELLEIAAFLTPHMTGHYFRDLEGTEFNGHTFYSSYFEDLMLLANNTGERDVGVEAMLRGGYPFDKDPNVGRYIGRVSFPLAKKILERSGTDDGTSVCSAVEFGNLDLLIYLLDQGVSPNQPIYSSTGSQSTALVSAIRRRNQDMVKRLLNAGADPKIRDTGYNVDALEMAESAGDTEIMELLKAVG